MACGLGAIILVFMIVKQNIDQPGATADIQTELFQTELLQKKLDKLQQQQLTVHHNITTLDQQTLHEMQRIKQSQADVAALNQHITQTSSSIQQKSMQLSSIKDQLKKAPKAQQDDVVKNDLGGEENYIMGIKVEGRKIILLLDSSASMTDEKLIKIIRRKNSSDSNKKLGPKWQRSKRIIHWLVARAPKDSQLSVIAYNQNAQILGDSHWISNRNRLSINSLYGALDKLVPHGSTNLQAGLQKAMAMQPSNIYVITDGLPTAGPSRYSSLNPFSSCHSLLGKSNTISGECRLQLFRQSVSESAPNKAVTVNVILLPMEGDPQAAPEYWAWSASTGGMLISPAMSWP